MTPITLSMPSDPFEHLEHDLNSPLNAILGFAKVLLQETAGPLTERQRRYLSHIHQSGQRLQVTIESLLQCLEQQNEMSGVPWKAPEAMQSDIVIHKAAKGPQPNS